MDLKIHLPGRLDPVAVGSTVGDRAGRAAGDRYQNSAPALRQTLKAWRELSLLKTLNAGETPGFLGFRSFESGQAPRLERRPRRLGRNIAARSWCANVR